MRLRPLSPVDSSFLVRSRTPNTLSISNQLPRGRSTVERRDTRTRERVCGRFRLRSCHFFSNNLSSTGQGMPSADEQAHRMLYEVPPKHCQAIPDRLNFRHQQPFCSFCSLRCLDFCALRLARSCTHFQVATLANCQKARMFERRKPVRTKINSTSAAAMLLNVPNRQ